MKLIKEKLRVVHIPQVPMKGFIVEVKNEREAYLIEQTLINQHLFLFENNCIPDYSNVVCVESYDEENEEWCDYWNEEECKDWEGFCEDYSEYINGNPTAVVEG